MWTKYKYICQMKSVGENLLLCILFIYDQKSWDFWCKYQINRQNIKNAGLGKKKTVVIGEGKERNTILFHAIIRHTVDKNISLHQSKRKQTLSGGVILHSFMPHPKKELESPRPENTHGSQEKDCIFSLFLSASFTYCCNWHFSKY